MSVAYDNIERGLAVRAPLPRARTLWKCMWRALHNKRAHYQSVVNLNDTHSLIIASIAPLSLFLFHLCCVLSLSDRASPLPKTDAATAHVFLRTVFWCMMQCGKKRSSGSSGSKHDNRGENRNRLEVLSSSCRTCQKWRRMFSTASTLLSSVLMQQS